MSALSPKPLTTPLRAVAPSKELLKAVVAASDRAVLDRPCAPQVFLPLVRVWGLGFRGLGFRGLGVRVWLAGSGKENGNYYGMYWDYVGIMEKTMETPIVIYWGYIGIMEKKIEYYGNILGLYRDNGKDNGNSYSNILGLYRDNGKENGILW